MKYNRQQLLELEKLYGIKFETMKSRQKAHGKQALDSMIIEKICNDRVITLKMFLAWGED